MGKREMKDEGEQEVGREQGHVRRRGERKKGGREIRMYHVYSNKPRLQ